jgi:hypothetical protein
MLTIIDTFTWPSPAIDVRLSCRSANVVATLEGAIVEMGVPKARWSSVGSKLSHA